MKLKMNDEIGRIRITKFEKSSASFQIEKLRRCTGEKLVLKIRRFVKTLLP